MRGRVLAASAVLILGCSLFDPDVVFKNGALWSIGGEGGLWDDGWVWVPSH